MNYELFKIETKEGDVTFVISENETIASAVFTDYDPPKDGEYQLYRIFSWSDQLPVEQRKNIDDFLDLGPATVVLFDEDSGWSMYQS